MTAVDSSHCKSIIDLHVNDVKPAVVARHILFLKVISNQNFEPENQEDMSYLCNLWYDATWTKSTLQRFIKDIKSLLNEPLPENIAIPEMSHKAAVRDIWASWLLTVKSCSVADVLASRYESRIIML